MENVSIKVEKEKKISVGYKGIIHTIDLNQLKENMCIIKDFGGDKRVICMENGKLKMFELIE